MSARLQVIPPSPAAPLFSVEAEMSVLGGMLVDPERGMEAVASMEPWMFYRESHRKIFRCAQKLWAESRIIDVVGMASRLIANREYDAIGGPEYLAQLWDYVPTAANIEYHIGIVVRHALRRRILEQTEKIQLFVRSSADASMDELRAESERLIREAAAPMSLMASGSGFVLARSLIWPEMERLEKIDKGEYEVRGIRTGLRDLDAKLVGMNRGDLILVAGRPSMGKSALGVCNIAADAAIRQSKSVAIFSIETRPDALIRRLMGSESRVNMFGIEKRQGLRDEEYPRLAAGTGYINDANLHIDHTPGMTLEQMRTKMRELTRQHGAVDLVVVDYLQLMTHPRAKSSYDEVSAISAGLKQVAGEFDVAMVALSQLSRAVEARPDKRPMMSDLRESGRLEQDADVIMLVYRPEYYFPDGMPVKREKETQMVDVRGRAEIILAKVRDGETGTVHCLWEKEFTHFADPRVFQ